MHILNEHDIKPFIRELAETSKVFTPQLEEGQVMLLPYEESGFTMDYVNFAFPVKEHLFRQREILFNWENIDGHVSAEVPHKTDRGSRIYFGVRPCDIYGIRYMDKFFLEGYRDEFYGGCRAETVIIALNCISAGDSCFCSSMGTGPFAEAGYDLLLTPIKEGYLVEIGTEKGEELVSSLEGLFTQADKHHIKEKLAAEKSALKTMSKRIEAQDVNKLLTENFSNPIWKELCKNCISCTGCTNLCPSCTCFNVVEESKGQSSGCRVRYWDSCQSDSFTRNAKEHNPRSKEARVRYRIYDKFKYIEDRFGMKGCTGCGRCINVCPAAIDIVDIINKLAQNSLPKKDSEDI